MKAKSHAVALLTLVLAAAPVGAEDVQDVKWRYRFTVPAGWKAMSDDDLAPFREMARKTAPGQQFDRGFVGPAEGFFGVAPYILVQVQNQKVRGTWEEVEKGFAAGLKKSQKELPKEIKDLADAKLNAPNVVREKGRVEIDMQMDAGLLGKLHGRSFAMLGKEAVVNLHCYAAENDFAKTSAEFVKMADSFKWDQGYEFKPGRFGGIVDGAVQGGLKGAVIGALVAGAIGVLVNVLRKKKGGESREVREYDAPPETGSSFGAGSAPPPPPPGTGGRDDVYRL
jgi:hypothetical protein